MLVMVRLTNISNALSRDECADENAPPPLPLLAAAAAAATANSPASSAMLSLRTAQTSTGC
jgi:hypothetical protein